MREIQGTILTGFALKMLKRNHVQPEFVVPKLDLAGLRQQKGISLDEIAQKTKISVRYLDAIERGQFAVLPGGIYNISYIRQYARAIDCDAGRLLDHYYASAEIS
jgi:transcriptional regulator with XRE-family HTH domain